MGLFDMQILAVLTDNESRELRQILQEAGFSHARTSRRGINTISDHFRDKPARSSLEKRYPQTKSETSWYIRTVEGL
jgi:hypothetical protein